MRAGSTLGLVALASCIVAAAAVATYQPERDEEPDLKAAAFQPGKDVISLTTKDFKHNIEQYPLLLVLMHAPWSSSCRRLYSQYNDIATELGAHSPRIHVAELDLSRHPEPGRTLRINGVPTLLVFRNGQLASPAENHVPRDAPGIVRYMKQLVHPPAKRVKTLAEAAAFVDPRAQRPAGAYNLVVFGFLRGVLEENVFTDVAQMASTRFTFVFTTTDSVAREYGAPQGPVVIFRGFDGGDHVAFPRETVFTHANLNDFINNHSMPLVGDFTAETRVVYLQRRLPMVILFSHLNSTRNPYTSAMVAVARKWRNVTFVVADPWKNEVLFNFLELDQHRGRYGFGLAEVVGRKKYRFEGRFTESGLEEFVTAVDRGEWSEFKKSEPEMPLPAPGSGEVFHVAYTNFKSVVLHPKRDVVVLLYNSHDRISREVLTTFTRVAKRFVGMKQLTLVAFDAVSNDQVDGFEAYALPKLIMVPRLQKEGSEPATYQGTRSFESIVGWIEAGVTFSLDRESQMRLDERDFL